MAEKEVQKKLRSQSSSEPELHDDILSLDSNIFEERPNEVGSKKLDNVKTNRSSAGRSEASKAKPISNKKGANKTTTGSSDASSFRTEAVVHAPVQSESQILAILNVIQENQKTQDEKKAKRTTKIQDWENYEYNENEDEFEAQYDEIAEIQEDSEEVTNEPPSKKQKTDDNNNENEKVGKSRFDSMANRCKTTDKCDKAIDPVLANNVNELLRNGMNETMFDEMTKQNETTRPENCEALCVVKTNQLVWDILTPETLSSDKKLQNVENSLIKGSSILTKVVNRLAEMEKEKHDKDVDKLIDLCNDSLALFGHANHQLNMTRRDLIKPEMRYGYGHLCASSVPYTKWLFGDDVSKKAKEIEDCSKIAYKIQHNTRGYSSRGRGCMRGRSRGRFRGRSRGSYISPSRSYSGRSAGGGNQSKNYRKETYPQKGKQQ